ncbi:unnamed protein product [Medioppia subpectinata]|uniref:Myb-like, SWIRM and MPN domain-containing protein 1 n=1 Tax=Medioppia subpectinata TaxID=1979941 RepID=A0A7R9PWA8_9ACAR|nr:unnamed protein product [Medioppia subpectinata]CAG2103735.1 unnamed protein product [Medioppia subpectinata]
MARMNGNTDSGIESDAECEQTVPLVVDFGSSVMTSRESSAPAMAAPIVNGIVNGGHICAKTALTTALDDCLSLGTTALSVAESLAASTPNSSSQTSGCDDIPETADHVIAETTTGVVEGDADELSFRLCLASGDWLTISMDQISEYEREVMREFFDGQTKGKSADSYREIRNHFLRHWKQTKPRRFGYHEMLRKVSSLHLGNVTAFSRVQKFLESHKAINLYSKREIKSKPMKRHFKAKAPPTAAAATPSAPADGPSPPKTPRTRPNPFKLVPLETFDATNEQPPFAVRLSMEALAIIDIHAHCVRTEVIGLLGGTYCALSRELHILTAEPCASLDDHDLQCDMEPVSQAIAKERLEQKSYACVGWYHSHPTFVPNPSLRDLETQTAFQTLFSRESNQPFVAFILSPYMTSCEQNRQTALVSKFKCLWVSDRQNEKSEYCVPMELRPLLVRREKLLFSVLTKLHDLCAKIKGHASRVQMTNRIKRFRGLNINHLEKLCHSLRHHLRETGLSSVECDHLLANCRNILLKHFSDDSKTSATTAATTATSR